MNLYEKSLEIIPGGVNSPVRALRSVEGKPIFITKSNGAYLYDNEGNEYIDFISGWGPIIHGHNDLDIRNAIVEQSLNGLTYGLSTELEINLAEKIIELVPNIEMIRLTSSGTEACMAAIRLSRAVTKRNLIIKFEGCYHGHSDSLLVKAGSGLLTEGITDSNGLTRGTTKDTITLKYNDNEGFLEFMNSRGNEVAAVIVEPVAANMGLVLPKNNFLETLRNQTKKNGTLLIFDEVITGFRLGQSGANGYFNIIPDIICFGKIIGGGMPLGAFGGKRIYMKEVAPSGAVYHAGTMSGNPLCVRAGITSLKKLNNSLYENLRKKREYLTEKLEVLIKDKSICISSVESLFTVFFGVKEVNNLDDALKTDTNIYGKYWNHMRSRGIILPPSQFEANFLNNAHSYEDLDKFYESFKEFIEKTSFYED